MGAVLQWCASAGVAVGVWLLVLELEREHRRRQDQRALQAAQRSRASR